MPLNLNDLMKKAKDKGIVHDTPTLPSSSELLRPWQHDSILFTENKPDTNSTQTQYKENTNSTQKLDTNLTQTKHNEEIKNTNSTQTGHKLDTKPNTQEIQTRHKPFTNLTQTIHISTLVGIQKDILLFIFEECKKNPSYISKPLSIDYIANGINKSNGSIKTSIVRLCDKGFLRVNSYKNGRSGWSQYEIPIHIYQDLIQIETEHKLNTNQIQTKHKIDTQPDTELNTSFSSSSKLNNINKTTTTEIPEEWQFDLKEYAGFGFGRTQLLQLINLSFEVPKINAAQVEQSLVEFKYSLEVNEINTTKPPIYLLMSILRSGESYSSPRYLSQQQAEMAEMAKQIRELQKKNTEDRFTIWLANISEADEALLINNLPTPPLMSAFSAYKKIGRLDATLKDWLMGYFLKCST